MVLDTLSSPPASQPFQFILVKYEIELADLKSESGNYYSEHHCCSLRRHMAAHLEESLNKTGLLGCIQGDSDI